MDPLAHDQTSHVESRTSQRIERKKDRSRLGNWNVVSSLLETILSQKKKKRKEERKQRPRSGIVAWSRLEEESRIRRDWKIFEGKLLEKSCFERN